MTVPLTRPSSGSEASWEAPEPGAAGAAYVGEHQSSIRPLLDINDHVSSLLEKESGIETPAIVVCGDQSTGKTSVLEAISGVSLPRGQELVTRCPLKLSLRNGKQRSIKLRYKQRGSEAQGEAAWHTEEVEEAHVDDAVRRATEVLAGSNKGIVDEMIYLDITRPDCPDMTLIDTPGITRVPTGEQPKDIESQIKSLIRKLTSGESKVLLPVVPADHDFTTAEGFLLAQEQDPEGRRTLGVVTKIDKAEPGIRAKLEGTGAGNIHLELGFVGVRCRKPEELSEGLAESDVRQLEQQFFKQHNELSQVNPDHLGLPSLVRKLVHIQRGCILNAMPRVKEQVGEKMRSIEAQLAGMPEIMTGETQAHSTFLLLLSDMQREFIAAERGSMEFQDREMLVAARVLEQCEAYAEKVHKEVNVESFVQEDFLEELRAMMRDARGIGLRNFLSHPVFARAFRTAVHSKLQGPARDLVESMRQYVEGVLLKLLRPRFQAFPNLVPLLETELSEFLDDQEKQATEHVDEVVRHEAHIMTLGKRYDERIKIFDAAVAAMQSAAKGHSCGGETWTKAANTAVDACGYVYRAPLERLALEEDLQEMSLNKLQMSLVAYTDVVLSRVVDTVALSARNLLVSAAGKLMSKQVAAGVATTCSKDGLLQHMHDSRMAAKRAQLEQSLAHLKAAWQKLKTIPMAA